MGVQFEYLFLKFHARDVFLEILMPMCDTMEGPSEIVRAKCAARSSMWTSIEVDFWLFSVPTVISNRVFSQCATRKVLSVFTDVFFSFLRQLKLINMTNSQYYRQK